MSDIKDNRNADLLLINPGDRYGMYGRLAQDISASEPPLWTGLLAGFVRRHGFSVKIIDADAEMFCPEDVAKKTEDAGPILVGIGVMGANPSASSTPKMAVTRKILDALKKKNIPSTTFLYGIHPSALPEKTLREEPVDFVCKGEPFHTTLELLRRLKSGGDAKGQKIEGLWYLEDGAVSANGYGELVKNLNELPMDFWGLLPMDKYRAHNWHCFGHLNERQPYAVIYTSLGCPFNCTYCNIHALYDGKPGIRFRNMKNVVDEIGVLTGDYGVRNIKIFDELFASREDRVSEFCDLIISRGYRLNMWAYARVDTVNDRMLKKMKDAGINWLAYGIESGSRNVRTGVAKGVFDESGIEKAVKMTRRAGINIIGNFIFGLPDDNLMTMRATLDMAKKFNFEFVNFYVMMAYPGSMLYDNAAKSGARLPDNWSAYGQFGYQTCPPGTKYISGKDVLRFRDEAFYEYFDRPDYLDMMTEKFGSETTDHIKKMLKTRIRRRALENETLKRGS